MKRPSTKILLFAALVILVLSIVISIVSLFPTYQGGNQSYVLVNDSFTLSPNETYKQGLGAFRGGENITILAQSSIAFQKNFSIDYPTSTYYLTTNTYTPYRDSTKSNITYSFIANTNYYEVTFTSNSTNSAPIHLQVFVQEPKTVYHYSWLNESSKIMFFLSLGAATLLTLKMFFGSIHLDSKKLKIRSIGKKGRHRLLALLLLSLVIWLFILAINSNPLGTFENWYTDNARHTYVSSLFLKDGFSVFYQPLSKLSSLDNSYYKFVTWPQMPHLYPLGSILLFMPFGVLAQNGFDVTLLFKVEIFIFLLFSSVCVYLFLKVFWKKDMALILKLLGVYVIYVSLIVYAVDGMFDSVAFLFSLFAVYMFLVEKYDYFFLLVSVSAFFKYQVGIFLLPLIIVALISLLKDTKLKDLVRNKAVVAGLIFSSVSIFTAYLSAPYLMATSPQLIMNGINAFSSNASISWLSQSASVLLTLAVTLAYAIYMLNKNSLLSLSSLFILLPSFLLPYFQNWYLPFIFVYALIPQNKKEIEATMIWLFFMTVMLAFSGANYQPLLYYLHPHLPQSLMSF